MAGEAKVSAMAAMRTGMALVPFGRVSTSIRVRQDSGVSGDSGGGGVRGRRSRSRMLGSTRGCDDQGSEFEGTIEGRGISLAFLAGDFMMAAVAVPGHAQYQSQPPARNSQQRSSRTSKRRMPEARVVTTGRLLCPRSLTTPTTRHRRRRHGPSSRTLKIRPA